MKWKTKYKILTWNLLDHQNYQGRIQPIVQLISEQNADIVLLQEVSTKYNDQTIRLFNEAGYTLRIRPATKSEASEVAIAYKPTVFKELTNRTPLQVPFRALSLDLHPVDKPVTQRSVQYISQGDIHPDSPLDYGNDILTVVSYHGLWGTFSQGGRLAEVVEIDKFAKSRGNAVILGGDFNAVPNEPAIQYLSGGQLVNGQPAYWVEAQATIEQLADIKPYGTSLTSGQLLGCSEPLSLPYTPERRIDYLLNYGFSYGRQYSFDGQTYFHRLDQVRQLSDHAPILAGLLSAD